MLHLQPCTGWGHFYKQIRKLKKKKKQNKENSEVCCSIAAGNLSELKSNPKKEKDITMSRSLRIQHEISL